MDNIKVAIRLRPIIVREQKLGCRSNWIIKENTIAPLENGRIGTPYSFDQIFDQNKTTLDIFEEICKPVITGAVQGFHGTIFAYGQSSSGKTFTMSGSLEQPGIISLSVKEIFNQMKTTSDKEFLLRISYMEIYNERVSDLLSTEDKPIRIQEDTDKNIQLTGVCEELVMSEEDVDQYMRLGNDRKHMAETKQNDRSSRSHCIMRMIIESRETGDEDAVMVSHLNFVDLAGSEKAHENSGDRYKEGCAINKSLFMLGTVISKLSDGVAHQHIGYRDSKLTRILQNALGGNSKTAIIATVTPASLEESHSTLRFASRAKTIKNAPHINETLSDAALLKKSRKEILSLQQKINTLESMDVLVEKEELQKKLEEKMEAERKQTETIEKLKQFIIKAGTDNEEESNFKKLKRRRETWCPGKAGGSALDIPAAGKFARDLNGKRIDVEFQQPQIPKSFVTSRRDESMIPEISIQDMSQLQDDSLFMEFPPKFEEFLPQKQKHVSFMSPEPRSDSPSFSNINEFEQMAKDYKELQDTFESLVQRFEEKCVDAEHEKSYILHELEYANEHVAELQKEATIGSTQLAKELQEEVKKLQNEKKDLTDEVVLLQHRLSIQNRKVEECQRELEDLRCHQLEKTAEVPNDNSSQYAEQIKELTTENEKLASDLSDLQNLNEESQHQHETTLEMYIIKIQELEEKMEESEEKFVSQKDSIIELEKENKTIKNLLDESEKKLSEARTLQESKQGELNIEQQKIADLAVVTSDFENCKLRLKEKENRVTELETEVLKLYTKLKEHCGGDGQRRSTADELSDVLKEHCKDLESRLKDLENENCQLKEKLLDFTKVDCQRRSTSDELSDVLKEHCNDLESRLKDLENENCQLKEKLVGFTKVDCQRKSTADELSEVLKEHCNDLESRLKDLENENCQLKEKLVGFTKVDCQRKSTADELSDVLKEHCNDLESRLKDLENENCQLKEKLVGFTKVDCQRKSTADELSDVLKEHCEDLENRLKETESENIKLKEKLETLTGIEEERNISDELIQLKEHCNDLQNKLIEMENENHERRKGTGSSLHTLEESKENADITILQENVHNLQCKLQEMESENIKLKEELDVKTGSDNVIIDTSELKDQVISLQSENDRLRSHMSSLEEQIIVLTNKLSVNDHTQGSSIGEEQCDVFKERCTVLEKQLLEVQCENEELKHTFARYTSSFPESSKTEIETLELEKKELRIEMAVLKEENKLDKEKIRSLQRDIVSFGEKLRADSVSESNRRSVEVELTDAYKEHCQDLEIRVVELQEENTNLTGEKEELTSRLTELDSRNKELESVVKILESQNLHLQDSQSSDVLKEQSIFDEMKNSHDESMVDQGKQLNELKPEMEDVHENLKIQNEDVQEPRKQFINDECEKCLSLEKSLAILQKEHDNCDEIRETLANLQLEHDKLSELREKFEQLECKNEGNEMHLISVESQTDTEMDASKNDKLAQRFGPGEVNLTSQNISMEDINDVKNNVCCDQTHQEMSQKLEDIKMKNEESVEKCDQINIQIKQISEKCDTLEKNNEFLENQKSELLDQIKTLQESIGVSLSKEEHIELTSKIDLLQSENEEIKQQLLNVTNQVCDNMETYSNADRDNELECSRKENRKSLDKLESESLSKIQQLECQVDVLQKENDTLLKQLRDNVTVDNIKEMSEKSDTHSEDKLQELNFKIEELEKENKSLLERLGDSDGVEIQELNDKLKALTEENRLLSECSNTRLNELDSEIRSLEEKKHLLEKERDESKLTGEYEIENLRGERKCLVEKAESYYSKIQELECKVEVLEEENKNLFEKTESDDSKITELECKIEVLEDENKSLLEKIEGNQENKQSDKIEQLQEENGRLLEKIGMYESKTHTKDTHCLDTKLENEESMDTGESKNEVKQSLFEELQSSENQENKYSKEKFEKLEEENKLLTEKLQEFSSIENQLECQVNENNSLMQKLQLLETETGNSEKMKEQICQIENLQLEISTINKEAEIERNLLNEKVLEAETKIETLRQELEQKDLSNEKVEESECKNKVLQERIETLTKQIEDTESQLKEAYCNVDMLQENQETLTKQLEDTQSKLDEAECETQVLQENIDKLYSKMENTVDQEQYTELQTKTDILQQKLDDMVDRTVCDELEHKMEVIQHENEALRQQIRDLQEKNQNSDDQENKICDLLSEIQNLREEKTSQETRLEETKFELNKVNKEKEKKIKLIDELKDDIEVSKNIEKALNNDNDRLLHEISKMQQKYETFVESEKEKCNQLQNDIELLKKELSESISPQDLKNKLDQNNEMFQNKLKQNQKIIDQLNSTLTKTNALVNEVSDQRTKLENERQELEQKLNSAEKKLKELQEKLDKTVKDTEELQDKLNETSSNQSFNTKSMIGNMDKAAKDRILALTIENNKMKLNREKDSKMIEGQRKAIERLEEQLEKKDRESEMFEKMKVAEEKLKNAEEEADKFYEKFCKEEAKIAVLENENKQKTEEVNQLKQEIQHLETTGQSKKEKEDTSALKKKFAQMYNELQEAKKEVTEFRKKTGEKNLDVYHLQHQIEKMEFQHNKKISAYEETVELYEQEISKLKNEIRRVGTDQDDTIVNMKPIKKDSDVQMGKTSGAGGAVDYFNNILLTEENRKLLKKCGKYESKIKELQEQLSSYHKERKENEHLEKKVLELRDEEKRLKTLISDHSSTRTPLENVNSMSTPVEPKFKLPGSTSTRKNTDIEDQCKQQ